MSLFDSIANLYHRFRGSKGPQIVGTEITVSNTILAGTETALAALIVARTSPVEMFPYIVTLIGAINVPLVLVSKNKKQFANNLIGGWSTTASAIVALNPQGVLENGLLEGVKPTELFATALIINTFSFMLDGLWKLRDKSMNPFGLENAIKVASVIKNAFITAMILMSGETGIFSPGEVFEDVNDEPENINIIAMCVMASTFLAFVLGVLHSRNVVSQLCQNDNELETSIPRNESYKSVDGDSFAASLTKDTQEKLYEEDGALSRSSSTSSFGIPESSSGGPYVKLGEMEDENMEKGLPRSSTENAIAGVKSRCFGLC